MHHSLCTRAGVFGGHGSGSAGGGSVDAEDATGAGWGFGAVAGVELRMA